MNEDKKYDAIRLRIVDDDVKELLDCYINIPKKDNEGNVRRLTESFAFYNPAFNFVKKTIEIMDGSDLENVKQINRININDILQVYEDAAKVAVKIIKSVDDNGYNTFEILSIE